MRVFFSSKWVAFISPVHQIIYFYMSWPRLQNYYSHRDNSSWWCPFSYICTSGKNWFQAESFFSPLCTGKLFLWKWTGLAGPLIPLCDSISFIKLWHLTGSKGIENSTISAFQSAGFLLKRRGDIWQPPLDPLAYLGCVSTNFCESIPFIHQNWKKMNNGEFITQWICLETSKIQPRLTESKCHHIRVASENGPGLRFDTALRRSTAVAGSA